MIVTDMLNEARRDLVDVMEEIGAVAAHLREAMEYGERDNGSLAALCCVDNAKRAIDKARHQLGVVRDRAGRWVRVSGIEFDSKIGPIGFSEEERE